jgi:hypothetical protein
MPKRKRNIGNMAKGIDIRFIIIIALLVVIVMAFLYLGVDLGFDATSTASFLAVLPYLFFFVIGLYIIINIGGVYMLPAFGILGFGLAGMLNAMYDLGMVTTEMMTGLSIEEIMFWTVLISLIFGGILVAVTSKRKR